MNQTIRLTLFIFLSGLSMLSLKAQNCPNDITPPVIQCPNGQLGYFVLTDKDNVPVTDLPKPSVSDDCGAVISIQLGQPSLITGEASIIFEATDEAGNKATPCTVNYALIKKKCVDGRVCLDFSSFSYRDVSEYIVVSSSSALSATQAHFLPEEVERSGGSLCFDYTAPFTISLTRQGRNTTNTPPIEIGSFTITPCNPCASDKIPPFFSACRPFINSIDPVGDTIILTDSDFINFADIALPSVSDNCDAAPKLVRIGPIAAPTVLRDFSSILYEATDKSGNKSRCRFDYRLLKRKCKDGKACLSIPSLGITREVNEYIVVNSGGRLVAEVLPPMGGVRCYDNPMPFTITFSRQGSIAPLISMGSFTIQPCDTCASDITPPVFVGFNYTSKDLFGGDPSTRVKFVSILTDKDSILFASLPLPKAFDNCDSNPVVKVSRLPSPNYLYGFSNNNVYYEAIDKSGNKAEGIIVYRLFKRTCDSGKTCIKFPLNANSSEYIVVSSSGVSASSVGSVRKDFLTNNGGRICFDYSEPFYFQPFLSRLDGLPRDSLIPLERFLVTPCTACDFDTIPPAITGCPRQPIAIVEDMGKLKIPSFISVTDNCDTNSLLFRDSLLENPKFNPNLLVIRAIDKNANKSEPCYITFYKIFCKNDSVCIKAPIRNDGGEYIVVSSSGNSQNSRLSNLTEGECSIKGNGSTTCFSANRTAFNVEFFRERGSTGCNFPIDTSRLEIKILIEPCKICTDNQVPRFTTCPSNQIFTTITDCAPATWTPPIALDNCGTPSVSSNYTPSFCFPIGTTPVIYTAKDNSSNTSTCRFNVIVNRQIVETCKSYDALNTNLACGCEANKFQPYGFYLDGTNGCPADLFKPDGALRFQINADNTATLKGNFRNNRTWELVVMNLTLTGRTTTAPTGSPNLTACQQGRSTTVANDWQYFTTISGTVQIGAKSLTISRLGSAFQVGIGANNQNLDRMGASGRFTLSDGKTGNLGLILGSELTFDCGNPTNNFNDVAVSVQAASPTFTRYMTMNYRIGAKNVGKTAMKGVVVEFRFPAGTANGGTVTPSVGSWSEWCSGNVQCFRWTIPALEVGQEAILTVPVFVLDVNTPIVATAKLLATSPTDGNATNDVATTTTPKFVSAATALARKKPTQLIPIVIQKLAPNPTETEIMLELESLKDCEVTLNFSTPMGQIVRSEKVGVEKGTNQVRFDVSGFAQGIYFVTPCTNASRNMPIKFVKM
jgi:hypothetical protein